MNSLLKGLNKSKTSNLQSKSDILEKHKKCIIYYFRVYMETVRLEKSTTVTMCSLNLDPSGEEAEPWAILSQPLNEPSGEIEINDENPVSKPLILDSNDKMIEVFIDSPAEKHDASAATKLIFVMGGFLICWLPYFVWLPTVHLLVCRLSMILLTLIYFSIEGSSHTFSCLRYHPLDRVLQLRHQPRHVCPPLSKHQEGSFKIHPGYSELFWRASQIRRL